jgi:DNA-binding CsgD family transcriptional regulator
MGLDLTARELRLLSRAVHGLSTGGGVEPLLSDTALAECLRQLFQADFLGTTRWDPALGRFVDPKCYNRDEGMADRYQEYYQFIDPISPRLRRYRGAHSIYAAVSKKALSQSEYYADFLRMNQLEEGVDLYVYDGARILGDLRVWRGPGAKPLGGRETTLLNVLRPYLRNHFQLRLAAGAHAGGRPIAGGRETGGAACLPRETLTRREDEVLQLIVRGASDKAIARSLGISYWTVRTHVANLLDKARAGNRGELAFAALASGAAPPAQP